MNYIIRSYTFEAFKHSNIVGAMQGIDGPKRAEIINRQLCHFFRADIGFGLGIAQGLGVDVSALTGGVQAH
ncbi:catalase-related domain-containing protein [uncultured Pontibacter sp.]|uniref:catalase-related domain-containing protein n=1 Tax=uncultured Pontibacter sp. TaxID=453356 RepID=UPI002616F088|nr:catalase-related domain-containing protein [uncultured Pontibacter sp.]